MVAEPLCAELSDTVPVHFPRLAEQTARAAVLGTTALMVCQGALPILAQLSSLGRAGTYVNRATQT